MKRHSRVLLANTPRGFSIIEILIAIIIFAIGLLAFSSLLGNLSRSSIDAKVRTLASNIGEEQIESQRRFSRVASDPAGVQHAYDDVGNASFTASRGAINFDLTQTVTEYYWDRANAQFSTTAPAGQVNSDFKKLELVVAWQNPLEYRIDATTTTSDQLGSGSVQFTAIISSQATATNRLAQLDNINGDTFLPPLPGGGILDL